MLPLGWLRHHSWVGWLLRVPAQGRAPDPALNGTCLTYTFSAATRKAQAQYERAWRSRTASRRQTWILSWGGLSEASARILQLRRAKRTLLHQSAKEAVETMYHARSWLKLVRPWANAKRIAKSKARQEKLFALYVRPCAGVKPGFYLFGHSSAASFWLTSASRSGQQLIAISD